jgi:hypothetical protein
LSRFLVLAALAAPAFAQNTVQIPLARNWNGIVHAGEAGQPDAPNGFRSISDRALSFVAGVPNDPTLARYAIPTQAGVLDMVHLGNRNTVNGSGWAFEATPNTNDVGIQPAWLPNVNQTGPLTTVLATPVLLGLSSTASVLFQISNGGGSFDITFGYQSGGTRVRTVSGPDWFGGNLPGTQNVDRGLAGGNLNVVERTVDLSIDAGETLVRVSFGNRSNTNAGYGIFGLNVEAAPVPKRVNAIALNCNWNGIVHAGEAGQPDAPNGFRSIADRALDFTGGVPGDPILAEFELVETPGALDLVMLGNRNTVAGGSVAFDALPNGNSIGVQPAWLSNPDLTGPQTTVLASPVLLDAASTASFLFQVSNGGGSFDVTFGFATGAVTATLTGSDWLGGSYPGAFDTDRGLPGAPLRIDLATVDLSPAAGLVLQSITFGNRSNPNASCAILAANVSGCLACPNAGSIVPLGGGNGPTMSTTSTGHLGAPLSWTVAGATPNTLLGFFAVDFALAATPLAQFFPSCTGTVRVANPIVVGAPVGPTGSATYVIPAQTAPSFCGVALVVQYAEFVGAACPVRLGNALAITIGN